MPQSAGLGNEMEEVKLMSSLMSPMGLRIVWALKLKGIEYDTIYEDLDNKSSLLLEYNPIHKKVPVLLHNGTPICESLVILEYIDETWNKINSLLPEDPLGRASARFWAKFCDEQVVPLFHRFCISQGKDEEAKEKSFENLKLVEDYLRGKKFFGGETLGYLDLAFGWLAYFPGIIKLVSNIEVLDKETFPNICSWKDLFYNIPVIKENWPDENAIILQLLKTAKARGM